jgi:hypothetical protein
LVFSGIFAERSFRLAEVFREVEQLEFSRLPGLRPFKIAPAQRGLGVAFIGLVEDQVGTLAPHFTHAGMAEHRGVAPNR